MEVLGDVCNCAVGDPYDVAGGVFRKYVGKSNRTSVPLEMLSTPSFEKILEALILVVATIFHESLLITLEIVGYFSVIGLT